MKINDDVIDKIRDEAKEFFVDSSGCHDWSHVERVRDLAVRIAKEEKADIDIVKISVYLHDIGRKEEMQSSGRIDHAEKGAELAEKILLKYDLDRRDFDNIIHCVLSHRYRNDHIPETVEAKVLFDADKLDSIGAIGVARDFLFAGYAGSNCLYTGNEKELSKGEKDFSYTKEDSALLEYYSKLVNIKDKIITKTGKRIAENRHNYMTDFFDRFEKEVKGEL